MRHAWMSRGTDDVVQDRPGRRGAVGASKPSPRARRRGSESAAIGGREHAKPQRHAPCGATISELEVVSPAARAANGTRNRPQRQANGYRTPRPPLVFGAEIQVFIAGTAGGLIDSGRWDRGRIVGAADFPSPRVGSATATCDRPARVGSGPLLESIHVLEVIVAPTTQHDPRKSDLSRPRDRRDSGRDSGDSGRAHPAADPRHNKIPSDSARYQSRKKLTLWILCVHVSENGMTQTYV